MPPRTPRRPAHPWEKHYPSDVSWDLAVGDGLLHEVFLKTAKRYPARVCVDFMGAKTTYAEMRGLVEGFASGLQALGVQPGERVGLCLPNTPYFVASYYGAMLAGALVVNFNPLLTADELAQQVRDSGTVVMVTVDLEKIYPKVAALVGQTPLRDVVVARFANALPVVSGVLFRLVKGKELATVKPAKWLHEWSDVVKSTALVVNSRAKSSDTALLQYTGGTTGLPKGACLTHANLLANTEQVRRWLGKTKPGGERFLVVLPLFHALAMTSCLNLPVAVGATMVLLPMFKMNLFLKTVARTRPSLVPGVPSLFGALVNLPGIEKHDLRCIRWCISGGAPLPAEIKSRFEAMTGCVLVEGYGLTEASPVVACNPRHNNGKSGAIGLPLPGTEIEVRDLKHPLKRAKRGETGEIYVRGPQVMRGYWQRPTDTRRALRGGWLKTGDVGRMDKDGFVFLTDRIKDIIITNGYNVYPRMIEEAMYRHPAVAEVTAIAIPHPHKGEAAKLFVALKKGQTATEAEILAFARANLNPIECPVAVEIRTSLPKTLTGKLSKKELVAEEKIKREKTK